MLFATPDPLHDRSYFAGFLVTVLPLSRNPSHKPPRLVILCSRPEYSIQHRMYTGILKRRRSPPPKYVCACMIDRAGREKGILTVQSKPTERDKSLHFDMTCQSLRWPLATLSHPPATPKRRHRGGVGARVRLCGKIENRVSPALGVSGDAAHLS